MYPYESRSQSAGVMEGISGASSTGEGEGIERIGKLAAVYATLDQLRAHVSTSSLDIATPMFVVPRTLKLGN